MRYLLIIFVLVLSLNVSAQSAKVSELFSEGTKNANQEHFTEAVQNYKSALSIAENEYLDFGYRAKLRYNIGVCYYRLGKYDEAVDNFKRAILLKKDYTVAHSALNVAESRRQEWKRTTAAVK